MEGFSGKDYRVGMPDPGGQKWRGDIDTVVKFKVDYYAITPKGPVYKFTYNKNYRDSTITRLQ